MNRSTAYETEPSFSGDTTLNYYLLTYTTINPEQNFSLCSQFYEY